MPNAYTDKPSYEALSDESCDKHSKPSELICGPAAFRPVRPKLDGLKTFDFNKPELILRLNTWLTTLIQSGDSGSLFQYRGVARQMVEDQHMDRKWESCRRPLSDREPIDTHYCRLDSSDEVFCS